jgi:diphosphomevalonate decarboxylase
MFEVKIIVEKCNRASVVANILNSITNHLNYTDCHNKVGKAFAPSNIALVKYWGKSDTKLNIPYTDSLSISLGNLGATTEISILDQDDYNKDIIYLNNKVVDDQSEFYLRIKEFLDLFRVYSANTANSTHSTHSTHSTATAKPYNYYYKIMTTLNIPVAAGVASSACGFAALILALDNLFNWQLDKTNLSILARLGSGSAARSLWNGFVYWQKGNLSTGMDSYAYPLADLWPELCIGLLIISAEQKKVSSRTAMLRTVETSILYQLGWQEQVKRDLQLLKLAIQNKDLNLLGATAENNALAMHATMLAAKPAINYYTAETIEAMHKVWQLRQQGIDVYFTQDAGSNLKLIFAEKDRNLIKSNFNIYEID